MGTEQQLCMQHKTRRMHAHALATPSGPLTSQPSWANHANAWVMSRPSDFAGVGAAAALPRGGLPLGRVGHSICCCNQ